MGDQDASGDGTVARELAGVILSEEEHHPPDGAGTPDGEPDHQTWCGGLQHDSTGIPYWRIPVPTVEVLSTWVSTDVYGLHAFWDKEPWKRRSSSFAGGAGEAGAGALVTFPQNVAGVEYEFRNQVHPLYDGREQPREFRGVLPQLPEKIEVGHEWTGGLFFPLLELAELDDDSRVDLKDRVAKTNLASDFPPVSGGSGLFSQRRGPDQQEPPESQTTRTAGRTATGASSSSTAPPRDAFSIFLAADREDLEGLLIAAVESVLVAARREQEPDEEEDEVNGVELEEGRVLRRARWMRLGSRWVKNSRAPGESDVGVEGHTPQNSLVVPEGTELHTVFRALAALDDTWSVSTYRTPIVFDDESSKADPPSPRPPPRPQHPPPSSPSGGGGVTWRSSSVGEVVVSPPLTYHFPDGRAPSLQRCSVAKSVPQKSTSLRKQQLLLRFPT